MQNTRWLTRNTLRCWWWWWWWRKQKRRRTTARKNHLFLKKKRGKRRGVKKQVWASSCGCFAVRCEARGDCLARWWWWWWWCFLSFVSLMSDARFWKIKSISLNSSSSLLPLTTKKKKKNKTMKRRRTFIRLAYHSKHNTIWPCVCVCINYIIMRGNII